MSRWIDADHAEFRLQCCGTYHGVIAFDTVKAVLNDAPSIDIVFCKDCKLGGTEDCPMDEIDDEYFCNFGEREGE